MNIFRLISLLIIICVCICCKESQDVFQETSSPPKSPQDELKTFQLEEGFEIQLVANEPMVQDPIFLTFDEDGRLWVVEMRSFMPDIDGIGESLPLGRISVLEDTNGDGAMDKSTVYLDSLYMPRALGLFKGGALVAENNALWLTEDSNGDLKADSKILLDSTYAANGIPEHSDNGLMRALDNWYYSAKSKLRYKLIDGEWIRDITEARGQYGINQDDQGRLIYNYNWSQLHGDLVPANYFSRNPNHQVSTGIDHGLTIDRRVYPIRPNPAVNRGYIPGTLDERGKLLEFTAACSPTVFRSTLFPEEYYGNAFVCEPAGNLIKRNVIEQKGLVLEAFDPNPGKEFLASTDERFRPVHSTVGPDGALYIADMYRGLIQHGSYVTPYLREQTIQRELELPVHMGRIWRIVPKGWKPTPFPKYSELGGEELIGKLFHPDGWHRDMAQRLLVENGDQKLASILQTKIEQEKFDFGRLHALWTLEGLQALEEDWLYMLLDDNSSLVQSHALRLLEGNFSSTPAEKSRLAQEMTRLSKSSSKVLALQLALSSQVLDQEDHFQLVRNIFNAYSEDLLFHDALMSSLGDREYAFIENIWKEEIWKNQENSKEVFLESLTAAVLNKKNTDEISGMIALLDIDKGSWKSETLLASMAIQAGNVQEPGFVKLSAAPSIFASQDIKLEKNRLERLKRLFSWPGYDPSEEDDPEVVLSGEALAQFARGRQKYLTSCAGCHGNDGSGVNRMGPTLLNSEWVLEDEVRLALIILHGMEGPLEVSGKLYDAPEILPVMPSHSTMDDASIAAILTYIRNEWGNQAEPVSPRTVGTTRHQTQGRVFPWTAEELNKHIGEKKKEGP
ncbi:MAG: dehydrogenase [Mongoliibacter sp.]|nr:MAG: dehydrogenase [Mongoliibacter sp.]